MVAAGGHTLGHNSIETILTRPARSAPDVKLHRAALSVGHRAVRRAAPLRSASFARAA